MLDHQKPEGRDEIEEEEGREGRLTIVVSHNDLDELNLWKKELIQKQPGKFAPVGCIGRQVSF